MRPGRGKGSCVVGGSLPKVARNLTRSFFEMAHKRCNSNGLILKFEIYGGELRAKLLSGEQDKQRTVTKVWPVCGTLRGKVGPGCGARGRRRGLAGLRDDAPSHRSETWPHWRGGRRRVRRARAGFEIDHSEPPGSRVAISRAAGPDGARNTRGAASNPAAHSRGSEAPRRLGPPHVNA